MVAKKPRVGIVIPAHNEEENIEGVLKIVTKVPEVDEILVVADVCDDGTVEIVKKYDVKILERKKSRGKGDAMIDGVKAINADVIMFVDADLETLKVRHIQQVIAPVVAGKAVMSVGLRDRIFGLSVVIPKIDPMYAIGGERAVTRKFFNSLPIDENAYDFGIETVMNYYARHNRLPVAHPVLKDLRQAIKEKKYGFLQGFHDRIQLMKQVYRARKAMKNKYPKIKS